MLKKLRIPKIIRNKYVLTCLIFALWMIFFDSNDVFKHMRLLNRLSEVNREKKFRIEQIEDTKRQLKELENKSTLEKFAREQYLFKKPNEEVFVIVGEDN